MCASWWMRISLATTMAGDCHSYFFLQFIWKLQIYSLSLQCGSGDSNFIFAV